MEGTTTGGGISMTSVLVGSATVDLITVGSTTVGSTEVPRTPVTVSSGTGMIIVEDTDGDTERVVSTGPGLPSQTVSQPVEDSGDATGEVKMEAKLLEMGSGEGSGVKNMVVLAPNETVKSPEVGSIRSGSDGTKAIVFVHSTKESEPKDLLMVTIESEPRSRIDVVACFSAVEPERNGDVVMVAAIGTPTAVSSEAITSGTLAKVGIATLLGRVTKDDVASEIGTRFKDRVMVFAGPVLMIMVVMSSEDCPAET